MQVLFIICAIFLVYVYAGFPAIMAFLGLFNRKSRLENNAPDIPVSFLIAAHNEENTIREKIGNALESLAGFRRSEILVGADGCSDKTLEILASIENDAVKTTPFPERVGKAQTLNRLLESAKGEVIVFSDADALTGKSAVAALVRHFTDERVGAVCGRRSHKSGASSGMGLPARLYNLYESAIKRGEGTMARVIGADGCLYAMRRSLLRPVPEGTPDDFVNVLRTLEAGLKVLYEAGAVARETNIAEDAAGHFTRKRRTVARGALGLWSVRRLLNPFHYPFVFWLVMSHKVMRWATPIALAAMLAANAAVCAKSLFYALVFAAQIAFYCAALAPWIFPRIGRFRPAQVARYFVVVNAAAAAGLLDALRGRKWIRWDQPAGEPKKLRRREG